MAKLTSTEPDARTAERRDGVKRQVPRFLAVGLASFLLDAGLNHLLWFRMNLKETLPPSFAGLSVDHAGEIAFGVVKTFTYLCGMALNFAFNRNWTFRAEGGPAPRQLRKFFLVAGTGLVLSSLVASLVHHFLSDQGQTGWLVAVVIGNGLAAFWTFGMHRAYTFRS